MNIEVKGINDVLMMKFNQNVSFDIMLEELNRLLDQPIFQQDGYFPRAFFDFGSRVLNENELTQLILLLKDKRKVIFDGISLPYHHNQLVIQRQQLHNGDEIFIQKETLFLGIVNPGSYVYCHDNVYFLNTVKGTIIAMNENVKIYGHDFQKAQIMINQKSLHDLTTSALTSVYYKDNQICVEKEDNYEQNYCHYFR